MVDIFISPHPDDIAYSCFGAVNKSQNPKIVISVFSKSKYAFGRTDNDIFEISQMRRREDCSFAEYVDARYFSFDLDDSSVSFDNSDFVKDKLKRTIMELLQEAILHNKPCSLYAPIGITWHRDHIITRDAVIEVYKKNPTISKLFLYEEYPYVKDYSSINYENRVNALVDELNIKKLVLMDIKTQDIEGWKRGYRIYKSQFNIEEYDYCERRKVNNGFLHERVWAVVL